ncbi:MAG: sulfotransferase domain-containing protein [Acidobacteria bacterium]|nr:sulfotransferase domain-containing protein [Acidobacteriota bacterium]
MSPSSTAPSRATTVEGIRRRMAGFSTPEGLARGRNFKLRPTDVLIATYPKAGTTLMQQIVHGLRTGGDMDFDEITEVVPWLELAHDLGLDLEAPQPAEPRVFKTHFDRHSAPRGGRTIYVARDPADSLVSFYYFFSGWIFEPGAVSIENFALDYVLHGSRSGRYWDHLVSWWPHRLDADTLWLCFEDIVADLPAAVARVARFMDLDPEHPNIEIATRQASIDFMRKHGSKFDDNLVRRTRNGPCGLPPEAFSSKVRKGRVGESKLELPSSVVTAWDREWRRIVEPATGHQSYGDLRTAVAKPP